MNYLLNGNLAAWLCSECRETLSNVKVRLYDVSTGSDLTHLVAANAKDTLAVTPPKTVDEKKKLLLGEATTDANGNFQVKLTDKNYKGGALEVAVYCETVPGQPKGKSKAKPVEFVITTIQPTWRETNSGLVASWEYVIPYRFWCNILAMFDVWVICGRVVSCENPQIPIGGVDVTAMDADWIHDDKLGTATTDSTGHFKIYYTSKDFKKTFLSPVINVETPFPPYHSGPDVYFKVVSSGGTKLIDEKRPDGQKPGRANIGNCFCITLCVPIPDDNQNPTMESAWTGIGTDFTIPAGSDLNDFDAEGYAGSLKYAFTGVIRTTGQAPNKMNGNPIEYRFLVSKTTANNGDPLLPASNFTLVVGKDPGLFVKIKIGQMWRFNPTFKIVDIYAEQADLDPDGWLDVNKSIERTFIDRPDLNPADLSVPNLWHWIDLDGMMGINTNALTSAADVNITGKNAGDDIPPAERIPIEKMAIRFEIREVIDKTASVFNYLPGSGQTLNSMVVNNNASVKLLAMKEHQLSTFCSPLSGKVHVVYTAYHPHLLNTTLHIRKNSNPSFTALPSDGITPVTGNTNPAVNLLRNSAGIEVPSSILTSSCTYIVRLVFTRRLHNGDGAVSTESVDTSFYYTV